MVLGFILVFSNFVLAQNAGVIERLEKLKIAANAAQSNADNG